MEERIVSAIMDAVSAERVLSLELQSVSIPSPSFEEGPLADFLAKYMQELGLDVQMYEVSDPSGSGKRSKQPVGRINGVGGGPSLMLNGHMDHPPAAQGESGVDFRDGWVYGRGSQDNKGGVVAAISAAEALITAGIRLRGDLLVCPVVGHKAGATGTRDLIRRGILPTYCINTENSGNNIANYCVGAVKILVHACAEPTYFHSPAARRDAFANPHEQLARVIVALGPSLRTIARGGWLRYTPHPELPEYPQLTLDSLESKYLSEGRATLEFQIRTVPGMSVETISADITRLVNRLTAQNPQFRLEVEVPPRQGKFAAWDWPALQTPHDHLLVRSLAGWHQRINGRMPVIGAAPRFGTVSDGNVLAAHGVQTILYGPGDLELLSQWPTPGEKVKLSDIVNAAKAYALTAAEVCILA